MFNLNSDGIKELKQTFLFATAATLLIIFVCWLFFDVHIVRRTRSLFGLSMGKITIIDDCGIAGIEGKLLPLMKKYNFNMCVGVHPRWTSAKDVEKIGKHRLQPVYVPICYSEMQLKERGSKGIDLEFKTHKERLANMGIEVKNMIYPWSTACEKAMRVPAKQHFRCAFRRVNTRPTSNAEIADFSYIPATIIVDNKKDIDKSKLLDFVQYVSDTYGWGILIIRSGYGSFGQKSITALDEMLRFCRDNKVDIGVVTP